MFRDTDAAQFGKVIEDLCLAFNRPFTDELVRVFWESLKHLSLPEFKRAADSARKNLKKFPTPKDLTPERAPRPTAPVAPEALPPMSRYAVAANKILFELAYRDERRGFRPIATFASMPEHGYGPSYRLAQPTDDSLLKRCLAAKADYVGMAEQAEADGTPWTSDEFTGMCREGFEQLLGTTRKAAAA